MATRYELRSQTLIQIHILHWHLIFISAFDGMKYTITSGKTQAQLEAELSKVG